MAEKNATNFEIFSLLKIIGAVAIHRHAFSRFNQNMIEG